MPQPARRWTYDDEAQLLGWVDDAFADLTAGGAADDLRLSVRSVVTELVEQIQQAWVIRDEMEALHVEYVAAQRAPATLDQLLIGPTFDPRGYFVYLLYGDDPIRPLYVGESSNVLTRLGSHLGRKDRGPQITRVAVLRCGTAERMHRTEADLIHRHCPPWNIIGVPRIDEAV